MSINSYLQNLAGELVLSASEKEHVLTSLNTIMSRLSSYFGNEVKEKKVFGSYSRETILPRKVDENSDIDLMIIFDNSDGYKPQTFLNKLKGFAEQHYGSSIIHQSSPSIVIELQHIKFELTPAYTIYGVIFIPMNQSDWMVTDPDGFSNTLVECNKYNGYKIKPIVRLLKHWNIDKNSRSIASFELEKIIASDMRFSYMSISTYVDYAKEAFEKIRYKTDTLRVNNAIDHINKAKEFETLGMNDKAEQEIKKVFSEI